jgi:hypothetical protein
MHLSPAALDAAIGSWNGRPANKVVEIYWQRGVRCKNDQ